MEIDFIYTIFGEISIWMNTNQGVLTFLVFIVTMTFGWISGIFSALRQQPKLSVSLIDGPTFSCTFPTGRKHGDYEVHQTGIALYLHISNYGSAPTGIAAVELGYHWHLKPFSHNWLKYRMGWFWLVNQSVVLTDFQVAIGDSIKVFPFLTQLNHLSRSRPKTYLRIGEATNGVVYFEQQASWGGCFPSPSHGFTKIKLRLRDSHGRQYVSKHKIPVKNLDDAFKYNLRFGETHRELHGDLLPVQENQVPNETDNASDGKP